MSVEQNTLSKKIPKRVWFEDGNRPFGYEIKSRACGYLFSYCQGKFLVSMRLDPKSKPPKPDKSFPVSFMGGAINEGESPKQATIREYREETGFDKPLKLSFLEIVYAVLIRKNGKDRGIRFSQEADIFVFEVQDFDQAGVPESGSFSADNDQIMNVWMTLEELEKLMIPVYFAVVKDFADSYQVFSLENNS